TSSSRPKARQSGLRSGQRQILPNGLRSWLRRFLFRRASRDRDTACHCSLNLLAQFSLGRPRIGVCNRVAHLLARSVGFGSLGHQKALPPSFLLFSGLWSSRSALYARFSVPSKGGGLFIRNIRRERVAVAARPLCAVSV